MAKDSGSLVRPRKRLATFFSNWSYFKLITFTTDKRWLIPLFFLTLFSSSLPKSVCPTQALRCFWCFCRFPKFFQPVCYENLGFALSNVHQWQISTSRQCDPYLRQGSLRVVAPSPRQKKNHINCLKYFSVFLLNCKIRHASTTWKELIRKSLCLPIFRNITEITKKRRVYLGDAVTKLQTFVWIFNHVSRVTTWSLFNLRAPNLVK